ncbi:hypothetical protein Peur_051282 [Populus x canadensis]
MKLIATIEGITSIVLDPSKNTVTVIGEADPVKIICKVRKFRKSASIMSVGPPKEEKKDMVIPCTPKNLYSLFLIYRRLVRRLIALPLNDRGSGRAPCPVGASSRMCKLLT